MDLFKIQLPSLPDKPVRDASKAVGDAGKVVGETASAVGKSLGSAGKGIESAGQRLAVADRIDAFRNPHRSSGPSAATSGLALLGGLTTGMAIMYFFDPEEGNRRRAVLKDKLVSIGGSASDTVGAQVRHRRNQLAGAGAETSSMIGDLASDADELQGGSGLDRSASEGDAYSAATMSGGSALGSTGSVADALADTDPAAGNSGGTNGWAEAESYAEREGSAVRES
ncbi:MAG: hypothetical protein H0V12_09290 [Chloroflexi bacterium]|nr:hypothetical protein [Chloroflexota bacterium]